MTEKPRSGKQTLGQLNRKNIQERIEELLPHYCSKTDDIDELAHYISYDFHMNPHTIRYFYLPMFITVGVLQDVNGHVTCTATKDGLTEEQLKEEEISKNRDAKNKLSDIIEKALKENVNLKVGDAVEKWRSETLDEDDVAFCYDVAKNRILMRKSLEETKHDKKK